MFRYVDVWLQFVLGRTDQEPIYRVGLDSYRDNGGTFGCLIALDEPRRVILWRSAQPI